MRGRGQDQASRSHRRIAAVRSGFLHLAEALAFREDMEVVSSTVRALITTLRSGEKCGVEPELVGKGTGPLPVMTPALPSSRRPPCLEPHPVAPPVPAQALLWGARARDKFTASADRPVCGRVALFAQGVGVVFPEVGCSEGRGAPIPELE